MHCVRSLMPVVVSVLAMTACSCPGGRAQGAGWNITVGPEDDIHAVMARIREARKTGKIPHDCVVDVEFGDGTYRLTRPLLLTEEDSHVCMRARKTGAAVLSGGVELPPFVPSCSGVWKTKVPDGLKPYQLWVGGRFATRARMPNEGFAYMYSPCEEAVDPATGKMVDQSRRAFVCSKHEAEVLNRETEASGGTENVFVRIYQMWVMGLHRMVSFDPVSRVAKITPDTERPTLSGWGMTTRYVLENLRVALDAPGEWFHDAENGELLYVPRAGEIPERVTAVIPATSEILLVHGRDFTFKGMVFAHCGHDVSNGDAGVQAQYMAPAAVSVDASEDIGFDSCTFRCLAPTCLRIDGGSRRVSVAGSLFEEFGIGGVYIGGWRKNRTASSFVSVTDTVIRGGGRIMEGGVGVWIGFATDVDVCHDEICDLGYSGISSGWVWGYAATPTARIRLNGNYIHDLGRCVLSDMGGIYTLGNHPGSEAIGNRIHDIWSSDLDGRGSWGIYADEGTTGMRFESNLVYRTKTGSFHQHYGRDNEIRNNIFAYAREYPVERTRVEDHRSFVFEDNIVLWTNATMAVRSRMGGDISAATKGMEFNRNLYFNPHGVGEKAFLGHPFSTWQGCGMDKDGLVADPMLEDPENGRWKPAPDSPAWKTGFKAFDPGTAGVRPSAIDPAWAKITRISYPQPSLPDPLPLTWRESYSNDFEGYVEGRLPLSFKYSCPKNGAGNGGVRIACLGGARGQALEFIDAEGLPQVGEPRVSGYFGTTAGVYRVAFLTCAEKGAEMDFSIRGTAPHLPCGVMIDYVRGNVSVNGKRLVRIPDLTWWLLSVTVDVDEPVLRWQVKVVQDGVVIAETTVSSRDSGCRAPGWLGWNSNSKTDVRFWVDDIIVHTEYGGDRTSR